MINKHPSLFPIIAKVIQHTDNGDPHYGTDTVMLEIDGKAEEYEMFYSRSSKLETGKSYEVVLQGYGIRWVDEVIGEREVL